MTEIYVLHMEKRTMIMMQDRMVYIGYIRSG